MKFTIPNHLQHGRHGEMKALMSKLVMTILVIVMITVANRPTLVFLTNTTNTVNAFTTIVPKLIVNEAALLGNSNNNKSHPRNFAMKRLHNCESSGIPDTSMTRNLKTEPPLLSTSSSSSNSVSRKDMVRSVLMFGFMNFVTSASIASAADSSTAAAMVGTKQDPKYEACLSKCMYDCTKPKGMEQKSRAVCLPECKAQCATTKQQLMIGTPIK